ncbi:MAG: hypothetical protein H6985_11450 [Pseudomonadales bacterium]|nr:hypothetical protein [Pseudomonadales bacterium]
MGCLPAHGRIECSRCYSGEVVFDATKETVGNWRITANPLAWGSSTPEVVILGFSKGPTQAGAMAAAPHNQIAYKGSRLNVGKILARVGLLEQLDPERLKHKVDEIIADPNGRFHFGSLVRCTVEQFMEKSQNWKGSGGGMLDKFVASDFGRKVATNCTQEYLKHLPDETRLVVMFGLGTKLNYVNEAYKLYQNIRPGPWKKLNDVSYTDGKITVVHVEHFASQGALIPQWLGEKAGHPRARWSEMAQRSVESALNI